jgi:hypothetical protein
MLALLPIEIELDQDDFESLCDTAGYVIGHWAQEGELTGSTYRIQEQESDEWIEVTKDGMVQTIVDIIHNNHDVSNQIRDNIIHAFTQSDLGDLDGYDIDAIIQIAAFKEVVYG